MAKYRKKTVVIEVEKWTGHNKRIIEKFVHERLIAKNGCLEIKTLEGTMIANAGDYIIKGVHGEFYPCKPDIFAETYEAVEPFDAHKTVVGRRIDAGFTD